MRRARLGAAALAAAIGCSGPKAGEPPPIAAKVRKKFRAASATLYGAEKVRPGDFIDVLIGLKDPQTGEVMSMTLFQRVVVLDALPPVATPEGDKRTVALQVLPEEVDILEEAEATGILFATLRNPEDIDVQEERGRATMTTLLTGERINTLLKKRVNSIQVIKGTSEKLSGYGGATPSWKMKVDRGFDNLLGGGAGGVAAIPAARASPHGADIAGVTDEPEQKPAPTRSWFPESFLFAPLVVTDSAGQAAINVPVPDRLTTWRVLALAHSAEGQQAGAVDEFEGTLAAYVDPVVPGFLVAGDEVRVPLEAVNTTDAPLTQTLSVEATLAELDFPTREVEVPAGAGTVQYAQLRAPHVGTATLKATLGTTDAVLREIPVRASGKPYELREGGTLGSPRTFDVTAPADLDPETAHLHLLAYPGALALLRSELAEAGSRGGVAEDSYALWLAGQAPGLFKALDDAPNAEALRTLTLLETQRAVRAARTPDLTTAAELAEATGLHSDSPLLVRLTQRLAAQVARGQRPDGTFAGGAGWTLQRLLVVTADWVRAVAADQHDDDARQRAELAELKASGAFERNLARIQDGYTAAVILGSGAVSGRVAAALRAKVREAIVQNPDGSRSLPVPKDVVRPDGQVPSSAEATARAVLALDGDAEAPWQADLGATLLGSYSSGFGWGDGETNRVALRAVALLFRQPLQTAVKVSVEVDGSPLMHGDLSGSALKDVLALDAALPGAAGAHRIVVRAEPPVTGLGFALALQGHTPWQPEPDTGLELEVKAPAKLKLNAPAVVVLSADGPAGVALTVHQSLPAGVQAESGSLDKLVEDQTILRYHLAMGTVDLDLPPLAAGHAFSASYQVVATLAGTLHAPASTLELTNGSGPAFHLPPQVWIVE